MLVIEMIGPDEDASPSYSCPGCGLRHIVNVDRNRPGPCWEWNGDKERPTISPSVNVRWEYAGVERICHHFVRNGSIEFLSDSTHKLAGQTVPLEPSDQ
jgi:hypothetical protein